MNNKTKYKLFWAWAYCDEHDKSTEFMFQYMADMAEVEYDVAVEFVITTSDHERSRWYNANPKWYDNNPQLI
jgi:hypothetical protein